jgi:hypothetical protein
MPRKARKANTDSTVRFDATLRHLRKRQDNFEAEAAEFAASQPSELGTQKYQAALRELIEALIQHAVEVAKLRPELKRPN